MAKVIAKLHANGNLETVGVQLVQGGSIYSFAENGITVPTIIEYPPVGYRNYFIEKTSTPGYIIDGNGVSPSNEYDRVSDFIPVTGWVNGIVRARFENMHGNYRAWVGISTFNINKEFLNNFYDEYLSTPGQTGNISVEIPFTADVAFMRVSINYYDDPLSSVKLSVEKGTTATVKHYLAPEDIPEWVRDTGQPISIFPQGIVIKGDVIQSQS